ncbi:helix-turn-helix transcriptional regulator [Kitasatospora sp. HPMI-4]|uniref:helix-turn-helix transcriptional regulator n=1 Tax=Kitasatospora sp. HPMI-4 TaxID=3448443 RepID=UPI003F1D3A93
MSAALPDKPDLSDVEVLLLRQVAGGRLISAVSRATGIKEASVNSAVTELTMSKFGTPYRHRAAALGVAWGWVREEDVPVSSPTGLPLTPSQREVLVGLVAGETPRATATRTGLAETTVRTYIQKIMTTLGVRSRQQAAARAVLDGLVLLSSLGDGWPDTVLADAKEPAPQPAGAS